MQNAEKRTKESRIITEATSYTQTQGKNQRKREEGHRIARLTLLKNNIWYTTRTGLEVIQCLFSFHLTDHNLNVELKMVAHFPPHELGFCIAKDFCFNNLVVLQSIVHLS